MNGKTTTLLKKFCEKYNRPYIQYKENYCKVNSKDKRTVREAMKKALLPS